MTPSQDEAYSFWHTKWQLALNNDPNAIDDIKINMQEYMPK